MGQGGNEGWGLRPHPTWFYFAPSPPRLTLHDGENFLTPSLHLGASRSPGPPRKTLLLVNLPYN